MRYLTLILSASALLMLSCSQEDPSPGEGDRFISLSQTSVEFESDSSGTASVGVKSNGDWIVEGYSEGVSLWLSVSALSGSGDDQVKISCIESNPYDYERVAVLKFTAGKAATQLIVVQSFDPERTIALSEDELLFGANKGETKIITVLTSKPWTVEYYDQDIPEWLSISPASGNGMEEVEIKMVKDGEEINPRTVSVGFRIDRVNYTLLSVTQKASLEISASPDQIDFSAAIGQEAVVTITPSTASVQWSLEGYTEKVREWLSIDTESGYGEKPVLFTTILPNDTEEDRKAELRFLINEGVFCNVCVTQKVAAREVVMYEGSPKWSCCNLGAENPYEYGDYFCWGATEPVYSSLSWEGPVSGAYTPKAVWTKTLNDFTEDERVKYHSSADFSAGYKSKNAPYYKSSAAYTKYTGKDYSVLQSGDDAGTAILEGTWRMPTKAEWLALYNNCTWTWMDSSNKDYNGVCGYKIEGKGDYSARSIFLPAAGYFLNLDLRSPGVNGYYWTSELHTTATKAWRPIFTSTTITIEGSTNRCYGLPVRPVRD